MYWERLSTLKKAYRVAERNNSLYTEASLNVAKCRAQVAYIRGLNQSLKVLENIIAEREKEWRDTVLRMLEAEIAQDLAFVYPEDGYSVTLVPRVLRGKVHIDATASSYFTGKMLGDVADSQGRLFQQVVSFAALIVIMTILGVETMYIDEAFSGASKRNIARVNKLLQSIKDRGFNLVLIAQDISIARNIEANTLILSRSLDNKTSIVQLGGV